VDLLDSGDPQLASQSKKDAVQKPIGLVLLAVAASFPALFWTHNSAARTVSPVCDAARCGELMPCRTDDLNRR
jgi:hypothetical protein